jgi:splicing factor 3B subunit 3
MITHPNNNYFYVIESDHRVWGEDVAEKKLAELVRNCGALDSCAADGFGIPQRKKQRINEDVLKLPPEVFGRPKAPAGTWGSCIRIIDPVQATTVGVVQLDNNEAAFSIAVVPFSAKGGESASCRGYRPGYVTVPEVVYEWVLADV